MKNILLASIAAVLWQISLHQTQAQFGTYIYVAHNGDDTFNDGSASAPFATMQQAVDTAPTNGALILLFPGKYSGAGNYNVNLQGKAVCIRSICGPSVTTINCQGQQAFLAFSSETTNTVIDGLTITNGYAQSGANWGSIGIVDMINAGLTIRNCVFTKNLLAVTSFIASTAIISTSSGTNPCVVNNCLFYSNNISGGAWYGGSLGNTPFAHVIRGYGTVSDCTIANNALSSNGHPGGWPIELYENSAVKNTIVHGNTTIWTNYANACVLGDSVSYSIVDGPVYTNGTVLLSADVLALPRFGGQEVNA